MASSQQPTTIDDLQVDVLSSIFIRLLAKQLAQMRCVSKSWNAFLSQSSFIKSHLQCSIRNNDDILLFFHNGFSFGGGRSFTARPSRSPHLELTDFIKLPVDLQSKETYGNIIGSVNGLICFSYGTIHDSVFYIWNPSLSVVLTLPPSSFPSHDYDMVGIPPRFGFDTKTDDYKVVKVTRDPQPAQSTLFPSSKRHVIDLDLKTVDYKVEVYSMRKGFWQLIPQSFPSHTEISMFMHYTEFCVDGGDGHVHWFDSKSHMNSKTIVAFDLGEETFCEIPLPDFPIDTYKQSLGVLGGKLCVMSGVIGGGCEVWVMEEYRVAESWVKCYVFPKFNGDIIPYGFTLHNEFLFERANYYDDDDDHCFDLYDQIVDKSKCFEISYGLSKVVEYVDSLVWVAPAEHEMSCCNISRLKI